MEYILHLSILINIYIILALSLSIFSTYGGLISLSHAGFYGIGAYIAAILGVNYNLHFLIVILIAILICGLLALIISAISLKSIDDFFIISTLSIQLVIFSVMNNWLDLTNGPLGIMGIPNIQFNMFHIDDKQSFWCLTLIITMFIGLLTLYITHSAFGRTLRAISEDEVFAQSLGKNVYLSKTIAFTIGSALASIAGVLYAHYIGYINPTSFTIDESIFILSIVVIGGVNKKITGVAFATMFFVILPEILRFTGISNELSANINQIIYGGTLFCVVLYLNKKVRKSS